MAAVTMLMRPQSSSNIHWWTLSLIIENNHEPLIDQQTTPNWSFNKSLIIKMNHSSQDWWPHSFYDYDQKVLEFLLIIKVDLPEIIVKPTSFHHCSAVKFTCRSPCWAGRTASPGRRGKDGSGWGLKDVGLEWVKLTTTILCRLWLMNHDWWSFIMIHDSW